MIQSNVETFIGCESSFEEASVVLYGAPFDSTTSFRPGARFGPSAMRHESFGLVIWSFVSEAVKWLFQTLKSGQRKY